MAGDCVRKGFAGGQAEYVDEAAKDMLDKACAMFVESGNEMEVSALEPCQCQKQGLGMAKYCAFASG